MRLEAACSLGRPLLSIARGVLVSVIAACLGRIGVEYSKRLLYSPRNEIDFCEEG